MLAATSPHYLCTRGLNFAGTRPGRVPQMLRSISRGRQPARGLVVRLLRGRAVADGAAPGGLRRGRRGGRRLAGRRSGVARGAGAADSGRLRDGVDHQPGALAKARRGRAVRLAAVRPDARAVRPDPRPRRRPVAARPREAADRGRPVARRRDGSDGLAATPSLARRRAFALVRLPLLGQLHELLLRDADPARALWWRSRAAFRRLAAMVVLLAFAGCTTYVLYPAVPPWLAAYRGRSRTSCR